MYNNASSPERSRPVELPAVAEWWSRLEPWLREEILEDLDAPIRVPVVHRIFDLAEDDSPVYPRHPVHLTVAEKRQIHARCRIAG